LLIGAGLFARSLYNLMQVGTGMRTEGVLSFSVDPSLAGYSDKRARQLFTDLQQALTAAPGAQLISASGNPLLANDNWLSTTRAEGLARRAVRRVDPALPVYDMKTLQAQIRETHYIDRLITMLSAAFGLLATLLAAVGCMGLWHLQ
jgi:hypothetical protein